MNYAYHDLPSNYLEMYRGNIEKVTKDDVVRVAKKYVHVDDLSILIVGKAADFGKPLDTLGKVTSVDIAIPRKPAAN
jgi:zinc protease